MKILLVPKYIDKEKLPFKVDATVEAEYGSMIIKGDIVTLAHHIEEYKDNPAPCVQDTIILNNDANIVISHIDLDTLGGIASLLGIKKQDNAFWKGAEYIDLNGPHHLCDLDEKVRNKIIAYNSYASINHLEKVTEITDVTLIVMDRINCINLIIDNDEELIKNGLNYYNNEQLKIENCLIGENHNIRAFYSKQGLFCNANYYSKKIKKIIPYIITYNGFYENITISSEDGGKTLSCNKIMKELFGKQAGGHDGIAGSPRGLKMTYSDFLMLINKINDELNKINNTNYEWR